MLVVKKLIIPTHLNIWQKMINFDQSPRGNGLSFSFGVLYGWFYYFIKMFDYKQLGWDFIIALSKGIISAVIIGFAVKCMSTYYEVRWEDKLKKKILKHKHHVKKEVDNERAA